jgi:hypothetical protein
LRSDKLSNKVNEKRTIVKSKSRRGDERRDEKRVKRAID